MKLKHRLEMCFSWFNCTVWHARLRALMAIFFLAVRSKPVQEMESDGILEGILSLPWLLCRIRASIGDRPGFYEESISSMLHFVLMSTGLLLTVGFQGVWTASGIDAETEQSIDRSRQQNAHSSSLQIILSRALGFVACIATIVVWHSNGGNNWVLLINFIVSLFSVFIYKSIPNLLNVFSTGEGWIVTEGLFLLGVKASYFIVKSIPTGRRALWTALTTSHSILVDEDNVDQYVFISLSVSMATILPLANISKDFLNDAQSINQWKKFAMSFWIVHGAVGGTILIHALIMAVAFALMDARKIGMVIYWILCLGAGIVVALLLGESESIPNIIVRKWFHFLAVALFLPGYVSIIRHLFSHCAYAL